MSLEGQQIGRYQLLHLLGSGGMGEVYLATDIPVNRQVAIKVMRTEVSPYPDTDAIHDAARLFQREVKAIAGLDHPHILSLFDYGEENVRGAKITYMVMPLRSEGTLVTWLRQRGTGLLAPTDIAQIILQAANALQYAHDRHIIHQDVKPSNFLMRSNEQHPNQPYLQLSDFGVAKLSNMTSNSSQSVRGTPSYMAPEQWEGNAVPATDQYALAVMTYELMTGRSPFQGGLTQMMYQHINVKPQSPSTYNSYIPTEVDEVILHALAKNPADRFSSITAFAQAFYEAVQGIDAPTLLKMQDSTKLAAPQSGARTNGIYVTLAISAEEAIHGTSRTLTLPGGQRLPVSVPAGMHDGQVLQLDSSGKIITGANAAGKIILTLAVTSTENFTPVSQSNPYEETVTSTPAHASALPPPPPSYMPRSDGGGYSQLYSGGATPTPAQRFPMGITILLVGLVLLLVVGGGIYFARASLGSNNNPTTVVTVPANSQTQVPTATPTSTTAITPTSTATPSTGATNPYTQTGALVLNDPLSNNSQDHAWLEGTNKLGATCSFTNGAYQATQPNPGYFHACMAQNTNYDNFAFEVQMTLVSGDYAGIVFRNANSSSYLFSVFTTGQYMLQLFDPSHGAGTTLSQGPTSPINLGQSYVIAVGAEFGNIGLYVNQQKIASVTDPTLTQGQIGVFVGNQNSSSAVAVFSNAKVWK